MTVEENLRVGAYLAKGKQNVRARLARAYVIFPRLQDEKFAITRRINESGVTVVLIEQNVRQTLAVADYGYVLSQGTIVAQGPPDILRTNPEVQRAYFSGRSESAPVSSQSTSAPQ